MCLVIRDPLSAALSNCWHVQRLRLLTAEFARTFRGGVAFRTKSPCSSFRNHSPISKDDRAVGDQHVGLSKTPRAGPLPPLPPTIGGESSGIWNVPRSTVLAMSGPAPLSPSLDQPRPLDDGWIIGAATGGYPRPSTIVRSSLRRSRGQDSTSSDPLLVL
jgi:hypothetical protein